MFSSNTISYSLILSVFHATQGATFAVCPLLGPQWHAPSAYGSSSFVKSALKDLTQELDIGFKTGNTTNGPVDSNSTSISIALFSPEGTSNPHTPFFYEYHHTAPSLKAPVDSESIYAIGDLSQVLTVFTFLVQAGDRRWHEPVTKYLPELESTGQGSHGDADPTSSVIWEDITLGELATHMAGIQRDSLAMSDVASKDLSFSKYGFPELNSTQKLPCGHKESCSRSDFFDDLKHRSPVFLPSSTPIYSNAAFQILAYVLESISNKKFEDILKNKVIAPLKMSSTNSHIPADSHSRLVQGKSAKKDSSSDMETAASNGLYSSVFDLSRLGASILASDILKPATTRRWLKPASLTSNTVNSVGMPWEIYNSASDITDHVIEVFLKLGSTGIYSSYLGIVPAYNVGFVILAAGNDKGPDLNAFADIISSNLLPAILKTAGTQAAIAYAGTYTTDSGKEPSSVSIDVDEEPGMALTNLTSNGVDTRAAYAKILGVEPKALSIRLFPTNLRVEPKAGKLGKVAFRAVFQDINELADAGTPTCISWMNIDSPTYGGKALDEFIFTIDEMGSAVAIEVPALRKSFEKRAE